MFDYLTNASVIHFKEFAVGQHKLSCLGALRSEFEIALTDGSELNFYKSFLHF